jgi:hypothetical protein
MNILFLLTFGIFMMFIIVCFYNEYISDFNYDFETFCKNEFCTRIIEKESLDTIYKLYEFYNNLIIKLPVDDIRTQKLKDRYNVKKGLFEVDPFNKKNYTSYTLNKTVIGMCMREKNNNKNLHNMEILKFVFLHEVAHICTESLDHTEDFWDNFKWLLGIAYKNNLMQSIDFGKKPVSYCGMFIDNNPFFNF